MHKRTKKVLLGTAGLAVTLAPGILAASQPVISGFTTVAVAEEVTNVTSKAAAELTTNAGPYKDRVNWSIEGQVSGRVKAGDVVYYNFDGISPGWGSYPLTTKEGEVIGTVELSTNEKNNYPYLSIFGTEQEKAELKPGGALGSSVKITFNEKAAQLKDVSFKFERKNAWSPTTLNKGKKTAPWVIKQGNKVLLEKTIEYDSAVEREGDKGYSVQSWPSACIELVNNRLDKMNSQLVVVQKDNDKDELGVKKGDRVSIELTPESKILYDPSKLKVGDELKGNHDREIFKGAPVNKNGVYLQTDDKVIYKVVDISATKLVLEVQQDTRTRGGLQVYPPAILKDPKSVDFSKNKLEAGLVGKAKWTRGSDVLFDQLIKGEVSISGSLTGGSGVIIPKHSVTVRYQDESGTELSPAEKVLDNQEVGTRKTITPKAISGYEFVKSSVGLDLVVGLEDSEVILTYRSKPAPAPEDEEIVTSFLEEGSGDKLKDPVKAEKEAESGTIDGYEFIRTERKGNEVTHWFKKKEEPKKPETKQPNTRYVDEDGKVIEEIPGSQDKKDIPGYTYLRTEKDKDGNITHIYHKIVTRFVTDKGMTLKQMDGAQPKEDISGYEFVETKTDEKTGDVTHVYREVTPTAEPFTILKDDKGNVLKTTKGTHDPEDLPGYRYLRTEKDKDGNTVHIYHRIVTSFVTTKDGKEVVLKTKDGAQPKEEIEGYEFVETKTDEKTGDIKHYYKVKVVAGVEKKAPVQTAGNAGLLILPAAAVLGLGGLVAGLARRKKD